MTKLPFDVLQRGSFVQLPKQKAQVVGNHLRSCHLFCDQLVCGLCTQDISTRLSDFRTADHSKDLSPEHADELRVEQSSPMRPLTLSSSSRHFVTSFALGFHAMLALL